MVRELTGDPGASRGGVRTTRRRVLGGMTLTGAAALLAACGGDKKETTSGSSGATQTTTTGGAAGAAITAPAGQSAAAPKPGGRLKAHITVDAATLDPHQSSTGVDDHYLWPLYDSLVTYSLKDFSPVPQLAEKWETTPDGLTYTFRLRPGIKFHDGTDLNGQAVKYNFDRFMAPDFAAPVRASLAPVVDSYSAIDATTFQVKLKEPFAPFLSYLYGTAAYRGGQMVSPTAAEKLGKDLTKQPVGAGPFKFKNRVTGTSVEYERFADYWDKGKPYLEGLTVRYFSDDNVAFEETRSGGNDIGVVTTQQLDQAKKESKLQVVGGVIPTAIGHLILNSVKPPFNDARARKGLALAINRTALLETTQDGLGEVMNNFVPSTDWAYNPNAKYFKTDLAEAKRLMSAAGVQNGTKVRLIGFSFTPMPRRAEALQAQFKEIGLNVEVENGEVTPMVAQLRAGNYDIANFTWDYPGDPNYYFNNFYNMDVQRTQNFHVRLPVDSPSYTRINDLRKRATQVPDVKDRQKVYWELQDVLAEEMFYIPTTTLAGYLALNRKVGPTDFPADGKPHFERMYFTS